MWRINKFAENVDSDQSISEDDLDCDLVEDHVSLGAPAEKKDEVQVLSKLEMLRDAQLIHERNQTTLFPEGDFNYPPRKSSACNSDEEITSDNEVRGNDMHSTECFTSEADKLTKLGPHNFHGTRKDGICTWLAANAEADALVNLNDNADWTSFCPVPAKAKRSCKGGQGKAKPKFSFHTQSHKDDLFKDGNHGHESHTSIKGKETVGLENNSMVVARDNTTTSMAELLVRVQDKNVLPEGSTTKYNRQKGACMQSHVKRSILPLGHRNIDDDTDCLGSGSSDEDEENPQNLELLMLVPKSKTMADQFQEALGAASTNDERHIYPVPRHMGFGLFGKLQLVMQCEKELDSNFLNKLHTEDETSCFDVKILSRSLEAKLTVCSCSSIEDDKNSTRMNNPFLIKGVKRRILTIIFSSRICSDVDLEVGTLIRVHPPWKEVKVNGKEESIIISTYYSQL